MAPNLVRVPSCHQALVGLGHLRGEFIPVIALDRLMGTGSAQEASQLNCLLVFQGSSIWSLLVSDSAALESIETIVSPDGRGENANSVVIGTALFQDRIVRVLNPAGLLANAQQVLEQFWQAAAD